MDGGKQESLCRSDFEGDPTVATQHREIGMSPNSQQQDLSDQKQHKRTQKRPCQLEVNQRILTGRGNHTPESSLHCSHGFVPQGSLRVRNAPEVATLPCAGGPGVA